mmetsp:Transcript_58508/g.110310  ORF Transcript_58508/g.110310 Transcript_58508/m.110310 type:complete len:294 (-) Transcript_58508:1246-2127(-)
MWLPTASSVVTSSSSKMVFCFLKTLLPNLDSTCTGGDCFAFCLSIAAAFLFLTASKAALARAAAASVLLCGGSTTALLSRGLLMDGACACSASLWRARSKAAARLAFSSSNAFLARSCPAMLLALASSKAVLFWLSSSAALAAPSCSTPEVSSRQFALLGRLGLSASNFCSATSLASDSACSVAFILLNLAFSKAAKRLWRSASKAFFARSGTVSGAGAGEDEAAGALEEPAEDVAVDDVAGDAGPSTRCCSSARAGGFDLLTTWEAFRAARAFFACSSTCCRASAWAFCLAS